ncbi:hypothetical protein J5U18_04040 [Sphingobacteriaceae bacterium WQ 2009]|uniref:Peptidase C39 domain-containing protein n=1 Tax=Rhinopithecimicrobium faecis TaxID=2820698 RepID=A0A8T4H6Q7_9SPHI|nr:hypothetical protein [Sphingobacteriaceae bacterium WQ 2009]
MKFPFFKQFDSMDCGPTCLKMILKYHGIDKSLGSLRNDCSLNRKGSSLMNLGVASEKNGLKSIPLVEISLSEIISGNFYPSIIPWQGNHFVVICSIKKKR